MRKRNFLEIQDPVANPKFGNVRCDFYWPTTIETVVSFVELILNVFFQGAKQSFMRITRLRLTTRTMCQCKEYPAQPR